MKEERSQLTVDVDLPDFQQAEGITFAGIQEAGQE
jgi:hypothetical protein